ncbi:unnamed protein product [Caenorhabditis auriculariae]|uniref:F-box domain-containing protein n=1 Tax=Caenorhabditis auriculariae TaxID=2777116 RepID=A0A8S1GNH4_9PELO|nr:unnamed protein product [Caenorhabditis auriculariae]
MDTRISPGFSAQSRLVRSCEHRRNPAKRIALMASSIAFEIRKTTFKIRRSFTPVPETPETSETDLPDFMKTPTSTRSTGRYTQHRVLCAELSSFALFPVFGALSPSHYSAPDLLFFNGRKASNVKIGQLGDIEILNIMNQLDAKSLIALSQTCRKFRKISAYNEDSLPKVDVSSYEVTVAFNRVRRCVVVRALKRGRGLNDVTIEGSCLRDVLAPHTRALIRLTFGTGVTVSPWLSELLQLHSLHRLAPLALIFTGGALTKGNRVAGADLRSITEYDFIQLVGRLQPHLQEIQLATSRLFKMSSSPPRLLGLISLLSSIGIVYERPAIRFYFDDVQRIASFWRSDPLSRSCDVFIRRPHDASQEKWLKLGAVDMSPRDPCVSDSTVSRVVVSHSFLVNIDLIFHLH